MKGWTVRRVKSARHQRETPTGVFVTRSPEGPEVVVRLRPDLPERRWRCAECGGATETTDCLHTFAVALHLAETVLGLIPMPDMEVAHA